MRISDWSSDVCSSDLPPAPERRHAPTARWCSAGYRVRAACPARAAARRSPPIRFCARASSLLRVAWKDTGSPPLPRSEEHTSELQSLMRISYAVFCLKKKKKTYTPVRTTDKDQHHTHSQ